MLEKSTAFYYVCSQINKPMNKTNFLLLILGIALIFGAYSCKEEAKPKAVVRVVEMVDSVLVPVNKALVKVRPSTQETVLSDVIAQGYTNSSGYIEFTFDKELVLKAEAEKLKRDEQGKVEEDVNGEPIVLKSGYRVLVLKVDYSDNKTIEVK